MRPATRQPSVMLAGAFATLALGASTMTVSSRAEAQSPRAVAIRNVTVIDVRSGARMAGRTVLIDGNRISAVAAADSVRVPRRARVIDGRGKYLIPGLWDMHVHAVWPAIAPTFMPLFVANGVTGVREMFGMSDMVAAARAGRSAPTMPRLVGSGHILDGPDPFWPPSVRAATPDEGRRAVDSLRASGADFIKVYSVLPRDTYFAIAARARELGMPFAGHVPLAVSAAEASDSGQATIEHLTGLGAGCSTRESELLARAAGYVPSRRAEFLVALQQATMDAMASFDAGRCAALAARFARNGTWQVPTLTARRGRAFIDDTALTKDPRLTYVLRGIRDDWRPGRDPAAPQVTPQRRAERKRVWLRDLELVGLMHRAGVPMLAGTDALNPYAIPGFGIHDEMQLLVEAGLSPLEALRAATLNPARFLGALDSLGTIEPGKLADLVLLDADPLLDIRNTARVRAIVLNGRLIDDAERRRMLAEVERIANQPVQDER